MLMDILVGRYGWKCFEDGFIIRGGGCWVLFGCFYEGKIIFCIFVVILGFLLR